MNGWRSSSCIGEVLCKSRWIWMKLRSPLSSSCVFPFISCSWLDFLSFGCFWDRSFLLDGLGAPWFGSWPSSLGLNSQDSRVPRIKVFHVLEKTPILFDLSSNSLVPLIFWERSLEALILDFIWSRFTIWSFDCGLSGSDRSDRSKKPVWPVWDFNSSPTGLTGLCKRSDQSASARSADFLVCLWVFARSF